MSVEFHLYAVDKVPVPSTKPTKNTVSQCFAESLINQVETASPSFLRTVPFQREIEG